MYAFYIVGSFIVSLLILSAIFIKIGEHIEKKEKEMKANKKSA
jgi:hypothetical protein